MNTTTTNRHLADTARALDRGMGQLQALFEAISEMADLSGRSTIRSLAELGAKLASEHGSAASELAEELAAGSDE